MQRCKLIMVVEIVLQRRDFHVLKDEVGAFLLMRNEDMLRL